MRGFVCIIAVLTHIVHLFEFNFCSNDQCMLNWLSNELLSDNWIALINSSDLLRGYISSYEPES